MKLGARHRIGVGLAVLALGSATTPVQAQVVIPGDPYGKDPVGITDTPCIARPQPTGAEWTLAKIHQLVRDYAQLCRYRADDQALITAHAPVTAVFMGDSITDNWIRVDPGFFTGGRVDRGISGQTTGQMLLRFRNDVIALKPKVVHIMAGTNDIAGNTGATTMEDVEGNIRSMAELARANGIRVVIASVPPADHFAWSPDKHPADTIRSLNRWLAAYARANGFVYADYHKAMATSEGGLPPELARDGVHPTAEGYAIMAPIAQRAIAQSLGRQR